MTRQSPRVMTRKERLIYVEQQRRALEERIQDMKFTLMSFEENAKQAKAIVEDLREHDLLPIHNYAVRPA